MKTLEYMYNELCNTDANTDMIKWFELRDDFIDKLKEADRLKERVEFVHQKPVMHRIKTSYAVESYYSCPNCGVRAGDFQNFCSNCGVVFDWGDEE